MKRKKTGLYPLILITLLVMACATEDSTEKSSTTKPTLTANSTKISTTYDISKTTSFSFSSSDAWTIDASDDEMTVSPSSGKSGSQTVTVKMADYNCTNVSKDYYFTINSENSYGSASMKVTVTQPSCFTLEKTYFEAKPQGDTLQINFNTDGNVSKGFYVYWSETGDASEMMPEQNSGSRADTGYKYGVDFPVTANPGKSQRNGYFAFGLDGNGKQLSTTFQITQLPSDIKCSTDTITNDGVVKQLQKHTVGKGVPLVLMGDGFIDTEVADGTYDDAINKAYGYYFSIDPMTKLKDYFDVYEVKAVSYNNVFSTSTRTKFSCSFVGGSSTEIDGDNDKVFDYAGKAITDNVMENAVVIVVLNDTRHAGTCVLYSSSSKSDIAVGPSIAYLPMTTYSEATQTGFEQILHHEAIGHGFAKLADEYANEENGTITSEDKKELEESWNYGFCRNLSTSSDVTKSFWADLAADSRYSSEKLGTYEGGFTYYKGVWRATEENIMRENIGGFNAQQRRLIYNRCMRIANGSSWSQDYDKFVAFDQADNTATSAKSRAASSAKSRAASATKSKPIMTFRPTPPRIIKSR